jgi:hypothetical protein
MQPDAGALLWDARRAAELILDFAAGRTWQDYQADAMLHRRSNASSRLSANLSTG